MRGLKEVQLHVTPVPFKHVLTAKYQSAHKQFVESRHQIRNHTRQITNSRNLIIGQTDSKRNRARRCGPDPKQGPGPPRSEAEGGGVPLRREKLLTIPEAGAELNGGGPPRSEAEGGGGPVCEATPSPLLRIGKR